MLLNYMECIDSLSVLKFKKRECKFTKHVILLNFFINALIQLTPITENIEV